VNCMSEVARVKFAEYEGSELLGHNPRRIKYLQLADGLLGSMDNIEILNG